jgi:uncharacterized membrane protein YdbT with pleckstrin-like domain
MLAGFEPSAYPAQPARAPREMMSAYVRRVLQPNETVRFETRLHWVVFARGALFVILGVAVAVAVRLARLDETYHPALIALAIGVAFGLLSWIGAWWRRWTTEVAVTNFRVIYKRGFVRRHTFEMNMSKVESVHVDQSVLGRMLDYGDIIVRGSGSSFEPLRVIAAPLEFRNHVTADDGAGGVPPPAV